MSAAANTTATASATGTATASPQTMTENRLKIIFLGGRQTGKTSFGRRWLDGTFDESGSQTYIGAGFWHKRVSYRVRTKPSVAAAGGGASGSQSAAAAAPAPSGSGGGAFSGVVIETGPDYTKQEISALLWDYSSPERFSTLTPIYIRSSHAALLLFDLSAVADGSSSASATDPFVLAETDLKSFRKMLGDSTPLVFGVVTKCDTARPATDKHVSADKEKVSAISMWCDKHSVRMLHPVSAKAGQGVDQAMQSVVETVMGEPTAPHHPAQLEKIGSTGSGGGGKSNDSKSASCILQ